MSEPVGTLGWGHLNLNVSDLDRSIAFYELLGFSVFLPGIPYLGLAMDADPRTLPDAMAEALGVPAGTAGRACIMQLDDGFPKLDLTEFRVPDASAPLTNADRGLVRLCLVSEALASDHARLVDCGVEFLSPPQAGPGGLGDVAVCVDPDGTRIELLQVYPDRWAPLLRSD